MADIDLKSNTLIDTTIADTAFLFGADSQSATSPSVYQVSTVKAAIIGAGSVSVASGKTLTTSNTLTLAGTDGTTMTFPSTSATIARTDAANTFTGNQTVSSGAFGLSGNISVSAWTTNGVRYKNVAATLTDTSSSGTVSAAYTDLFGGNTIAASNSTTFTNYYTMFISGPTAGTNVTFTNAWALGLSGSLSVSANARISGQATIPLQTLTDAANIDWNCNSGAKAKVTLGGNRTINGVTNAVEGTSYSLWVIQDATGSRTLTFTTSGAGSFDFGSEGVPVLSTTASTADLLAFEAISIGGTLKLRFCGIKRGFA